MSLKSSNIVRAMLVIIISLALPAALLSFSQPLQAQSETNPRSNPADRPARLQPRLESAYLTLANLQGGGVILLDPFMGPTSSPVTVNGRRWEPGSQVVIYLVIEGKEFAIANTMANEAGTFTVSFFVPANLVDEKVVPVIARTVEGEVTARAFYNIVEGLPEATPAATPEPADPEGVVTAGRLNVRTGPGLIYPIVGQVAAGDIVDINGQNGVWWRIDFLHARGDFGWVSGNYINAQNTGQVPLAPAPPPPPPTPAPTPTPTPQQPAQECNPGQWSGCSPPFCPVEYVSQCQEDGTWGECIWDPGHCSVYLTGDDGGGGDDDDDDNDNDDDDDDNDNDDDDDD